MWRNSDTTYEALLYFIFLKLINMIDESGHYFDLKKCIKFRGCFFCKVNLSLVKFILEVEYPFFPFLFLTKSITIFKFGLQVHNHMSFQEIYKHYLLVPKFLVTSAGFFQKSRKLMKKWWSYKSHKKGYTLFWKSNCIFLRNI